MKYYILIETETPSIFYNIIKDKCRYFEIFVLNKKQRDTVLNNPSSSSILVEALCQADALRLFNKKLDFKILKKVDAPYYEAFLPQVQYDII